MTRREAPSSDLRRQLVGQAFERAPKLSANELLRLTCPRGFVDQPHPDALAVLGPWFSALANRLAQEDFERRREAYVLQEALDVPPEVVHLPDGGLRPTTKQERAEWLEDKLGRAGLLSAPRNASDLPLIGLAELWEEIVRRPPPLDITELLDARAVKRQQYLIFQRELAASGNQTRAARAAAAPFSHLPAGLAWSVETMRTLESTRRWPEYLTGDA